MQNYLRKLFGEPTVNKELLNALLCYARNLGTNGAGGKSIYKAEYTSVITCGHVVSNFSLDGTDRKLFYDKFYDYSIQHVLTFIFY